MYNATLYFHSIALNRMLKKEVNLVFHSLSQYCRYIAEKCFLPYDEMMIKFFLPY